MKPASLALLLLSLAAPAAAQDRPSEADLFGAPPKPPEEAKPAEPTPAAPAPRAAPGEPAEERVAGVLGRTENPLQLGGQLYLRSFLFAREGDPPSRWLFTAPALTDVYLDARPNDRVRAFVLGRMQFDPTLDPSAPGVLGTAPPPNPQVLLDQLWLRFDAEHTAFFTVGRQHVKWGTGRFWNPTDYLHAVRRDPLAVFDQRTGTTMVKVHLPWERQGWNFYGMAILEPLTSSAATGALAPGTSGLPAAATSARDSQRLGGVGGAARAEIVLGPSEVGLGAVVQRGHKPRFAVDASAGVLDLDFYAEAALKTGSELPVYRPRPAAPAGADLAVRYEGYEPSGLTPQVTGGVRWQHKYSDEDMFEVGAEYFWNRLGYADPAIYPWLIANGAFAPFYVGQHYAGVYFHLPNPGAWNNTTFILSTLGNLSDRSFVTRLDYSVLLLTYLRLEAYGQAHYGRAAGEFRLAIPAQTVAGAEVTPGFGAQLFDVGLALRVSL
ncbi:hypothetical protein [Anaeromyxobacter diazotrophicus]|uniref:Alginate export domain-containing protein n=1 Tax=Anaeromyxobacter diazotrophicus TaxID=2590199 RepID=A0A7I9VI10_9BACT|nr:hypothetical protein [Anaeromyxobacter diazotrophicus]GEJ55758.1 hypothetical protein AMYX_04990 [Anaeromyxobacter diazotrophicus]